MSGSGSREGKKKKKLCGRSKSTPGSRDSGFAELDSNYRPMKIRVFKNGDEYDAGTEIAITRSHFRHWLSLLDHIGKRTKSMRAIHYLHKMNGREVREFKQLRDGDSYVAVHDYFQKAKYGSRVVGDGGFKAMTHQVDHNDPQNLDSPESINIYLTKMGFKGDASKPPAPSKSKGGGKSRPVKKKKAPVRSQSLHSSDDFHASPSPTSHATTPTSAKSQRTIPASPAPNDHDEAEDEDEESGRGSGEDEEEEEEGEEATKSDKEDAEDED